MPVLSRPVPPAPSTTWPVLFCVTAIIGCSGSDSARPVATARGPAGSLIPAGPYGNSVRRGLALLLGTRANLPEHGRHQLRLTSCHLAQCPRENGTPIRV